MKKFLVISCLIMLVGPMISAVTAAASTIYTVSNASTVEAVIPLSNTESASDYYSYTEVEASGHPEFGAESNVGFFWLYEDTATGYISLGMIFDSIQDGSGGSVNMTIDGVPATGFVEVEDDPVSIDVDEVITLSDGQWIWDDCCTDGAVIGGLEGYWEITINLSSFTGIDKWYFLSGPSLSAPGRILLDMNEQLVITASAPPDISGCIEIIGEPLVGVEIMLKQQGGLNLTTVTDAEGCYEFQNADVGKKIKLEVENK